jgi:hypothetical protein
MLATLHFEFMMHRNGVSKLTVPLAISQTFKYKKEHGNIELPRKDPYKRIRQLPNDTTPPNVVRLTNRLLQLQPMLYKEEAGAYPMTKLQPMYNST